MRDVPVGELLASGNWYPPRLAAALLGIPRHELDRRVLEGSIRVRWINRERSRFLVEVVR